MTSLATAKRQILGIFAQSPRLCRLACVNYDIALFVTPPCGRDPQGAAHKKNARLTAGRTRRADLQAKSIKRSERVEAISTAFQQTRAP